MSSPQFTLREALRFDPEYQTTFEDKLFYDGPHWARRLINFVALLTLATLIATFGVIGDSTATIIGAMIVAPLMTPIMATAAALVIGQSRRALQSLVLVIGGVALVIALATAITWLLPHSEISLITNSAIASRITPGLLDLFVALASGAAGAYILMRPELADALGGVAIAISLAPPLCVVGVCLASGYWLAALGAFLLFVTNFLSILVAGSLLFGFAGVGAQRRKEMSARMRRNAFVLIAVAVALICIPLGVLTYRSIMQAQEVAAAESATKAWLGARAYDIDTIALEDDGTLRITISGQGELPSASQLVARITKQLGHAVEALVLVVPKTSLMDAASSPGATP
jgi:uncharacterized hydrophobic protein (TIGR00271 family)